MVTRSEKYKPQDTFCTKLLEISKTNTRTPPNKANVLQNSFNASPQPEYEKYL